LDTSDKVKIYDKCVTLSAGEEVYERSSAIAPVICERRSSTKPRVFKRRLATSSIA